MLCYVPFNIQCLKKCNVLFPLRHTCKHVIITIFNVMHDTKVINKSDSYCGTDKKVCR